MDGTDIILFLLVICLVYILYNKYSNRLSNDDLQSIKQTDPFFTQVALNHEFASLGSKGMIVKWKQPLVTYSVDGMYNEKDIQDTSEIFDELSQLTGIQYKRVQGPSDIDIKFSSGLKSVDSIVTENPQHIRGLALCSVSPFSNGLSHCNIDIVKKRPEEDVKPILLEEITQSNGLFGDSPTATDSVFYKYKQDLSKHIEYTSEDRRVIRKLYSGEF